AQAAHGHRAVVGAAVLGHALQAQARLAARQRGLEQPEAGFVHLADGEDLIAKLAVEQHVEREALVAEVVVEAHRQRGHALAQGLQARG
nr:hypothetical protein [Tanacetum cinerariifolium]